MRRAVVALLVLLAAGCSTAAPRVPSLVDAKREVGEYVASGRYEADIAAVVAGAKAHLTQRFGGTARLAIVLDIDETALSNVAALRANDYGFIIGGPCDLQRGPCGFIAWVEMARAEPIKPVLELARFARQHAVNVGDQASDLDGGYAERTFKLPNPFYFVP